MSSQSRVRARFGNSIAHRSTWILAFGLALLGSPAGAVPCDDDSGQKQDDREDSSIQLKPTQPRERSYDASRMLGDELPPVLRNKAARSPEIRDDGRAREWRTRIAARVRPKSSRPGW